MSKETYMAKAIEDRVYRFLQSHSHGGVVAINLEELSSHLSLSVEEVAVVVLRIEHKHNLSRTGGTKEYDYSDHYHLQLSEH